MRALDDDGVELNAEFSVAAEPPCLSMVLESAGGKTAGGTRPRNDQYAAALALLLRRLGDRQAVLVSACVASARMTAVPEEERALLPGPVDLGSVTDFEQFRLIITRAQGRVGLPVGAAKDGNNRKRLQLRLDVPGYGPGDAGKLATDLAAPPSWDPGSLPSARDLLRSLIGEEILTVTGQPNMVLAVHGEMALVSTNRSPDGRLVPVGAVQAGLDKLEASGSVRVNVEELGHRSAFVGAVLATLPGAWFLENLATVTFTPPDGLPAGSDPVFAVLDSRASVKVRKEQARLRSLLAGDREQAACALCGHEYPLGFLVAAHIKKRSICSDDERRDLRHVAMLACTFGCDALYETGWITVGPDGRVQTVPPDDVPGERIQGHLRHLGEQRCAAHSAASEPYFAWHRTTVFRDSS